MVVGSRNNRHVWVRHNIRHRLRNQLINQLPPAAISAFLGKFVLFAIAYIAYHIVMIVFLCQDSEPFENRYGESPKYVVDPDSDGIDTPDDKID